MSDTTSGSDTVRRERPLKEILAAANGGKTPIIGHEQLAKQQDTEVREAPAAGRDAARSLQNIAEQAALFFEQTGDAMLHRAENIIVDYARNFRQACYQKAEEVRREAREEAVRSARFAAKVNDMAKALDLEVSKPEELGDAEDNEQG